MRKLTTAIVLAGFFAAAPALGQVVQMGDMTEAPAGPAGGASGDSVGSYGGPVSAAEDDWKFGFNGFFRAPMRIGIGERLDAKTDQSKTTLSTPQLPSDQYLNWTYTKTVQRSWAEAFLSYGNNTVKGVLALQAFRFSDSSFVDPEAQFGIGQAWVEITPNMTEIDENLRLNAKVGSHWGRYGGAGRYDAGAYDTFIFGRTHTVGETVRLEYDYGDYIFFFEEGFGTRQPNPQVFHNTKFTLLAHAHAGFNWDEFVDVGFHILHAWTQEPDHACVSREEEVAQSTVDGQGNVEEVNRLVSQFSGADVGACKHELATDENGVPTANPATPMIVPSDPNRSDPVARSDTPDGSLTVFGVDAVFNTSSLGRFWLGYSRVVGNHAITVAPAIEVIHANGGGFFKSGVTHQYFLERPDWENPEKLRTGGNGTVDTIAGQWNLSLSSLIGAEVFGEAQLDLEAFFMLNLVNSEDDVQLENVHKLKFGSDLVFNPLSWFGMGFRWDQVNPRSDLPEQSFLALAPRLIFRSNFSTHEELQIGYARYIYDTEACPDRPGDNLIACVQPPGGVVGPDGWGARPGVTVSKQTRGAPVDFESKRGRFPDSGFDKPHNQAFWISASIWW